MEHEICPHLTLTSLANQDRIPPAALAFRRYWLAAGWALVLGVIYLSLTPAPVQLNVEQGDKIGHVCAYAALMSWFANLYEAPLRRLQFAAGFVALGVGLEFVQRWTGYRTFEVAWIWFAGRSWRGGGLARFAARRIPNYLRWADQLFRRA